MNFFDISYMQIDIWQKYIDDLNKQLRSINDEQERFALLCRINWLERILMSEKQALNEEIYNNEKKRGIVK